MRAAHSRSFHWSLFTAGLALVVAACGEARTPRFIDPNLSPADLILPLPQPELPTLPDGIAIRAVTYNIYGGNFAAADTIGAMLGGLEPDLVGLQECPADYVEALAAAAGLDHWAGSGVALLSRTPLREVEAVELTTGRSFLHALTDVDGVTFSVYVAHLGWNLDGDRQCREFAEEHLAQDPLDHLVLMGDFNDEHGSTQISRLETVVADAHTALGWVPGQRISWPSTGFDDTEGSQLIDLIFYRRDFAPIVVRGGVENLSPVLSDHKPSWADLLYPRATPFASDPLAPSRDPRTGWPSALPQNLLSNPGAEEGLEHWQASGGAEVVGEREAHQPFAGEGMFTGFTERPADGPQQSRGSQDADLSAWAEDIDQGRCRLLVGAQMSTGYNVLSEDDLTSNVARPYDDGELVLAVRDEAAGLLWRETSGRRDPLTWQEIAWAATVPPGGRRATLSWISHHKIYNGASNDALFDELYLSISCEGAPSGWQTGNLLVHPGAEDLQSPSWHMDGWLARADLEPFGLALFPPWAHSGGGYFHGGGALDLEPGQTGTSRLEQELLLPDGPLRHDQIAVWGGWLRSWAAHSGVHLSLTLFDGDGSHPWGTVDGGSVRAAEWTAVTNRTRLPRGTRSLRLTVEADVAELGSGAFADDLFLRLEAAP